MPERELWHRLLLRLLHPCLNIACEGSADARRSLPLDLGSTGRDVVLSFCLWGVSSDSSLEEARVRFVVGLRQPMGAGVLRRQLKFKSQGKPVRVPIGRPPH
jgi:hypothetical protein